MSIESDMVLLQFLSRFSNFSPFFKPEVFTSTIIFHLPASQKLRLRIPDAFGHESNPKFAEHAEHAFRGACVSCITEGWSQIMFGYMLLAGYVFFLV